MERMIDGACPDRRMVCHATTLSESPLQSRLSQWISCAVSVTLMSLSLWSRFYWWSSYLGKYSQNTLKVNPMTRENLLEIGSLHKRTIVENKEKGQGIADSHHFFFASKAERIDVMDIGSPRILGMPEVTDTQSVFNQAQKPTKAAFVQQSPKRGQPCAPQLITSHHRKDERQSMKTRERSTLKWVRDFTWWAR